MTTSRPGLQLTDTVHAFTGKVHSREHVSGLLKEALLVLEDRGGIRNQPLERMLLLPHLMVLFAWFFLSGFRKSTLENTIGSPWKEGEMIDAMFSA